jgi:putative transcriptional regulator
MDLRARSLATWLLAAVCAFVSLGFQDAARAQEKRNTVLVAKPHLLDPNFRETVVTVTEAPNGAAVGVIINRPTNKSLAQILPDNPLLAQFTDPLFFGGPVQPVGLYAVFEAETPPGDALRIAGDLWLALDPATVEQLMKKPPEHLRFYTGYSGWAPGQLANELLRRDWWVIEVDPDVVFRADPSTLWEELARRAKAVTASR